MFPAHCLEKKMQLVLQKTHYFSINCNASFR